MSDPKLLLLFDAVLHGRATDDEIRSLNALLDDDAEARMQFARYAQLEGDLTYAFQSGVVDSDGAKELATRSPVSHSSLAASVRSRTSALALSILLGMAAAVVIWIGFPRNGGEVATEEATSDTVEKERAVQSTANFAPLQKPPATIATLTSHKDSVWGDKPLVDGHGLQEGEEIHLVSGEAHISVGCGAEIAARGPCLLHFLGPDKVYLNHGKVTVQVAEWANEFTVSTRAMDVIDLGTVFTVASSLESGAEARVLSGRVRVNPRRAVDQDSQFVLVSEGELLSVDYTGGRQLRTLTPAEKKYFPDFGDLQPYRPIPLQNTGTGLTVGDQDPHWRVVTGPEGFQGPQDAIVCDPAAHTSRVDHYLPNDPAVSQWISVSRWQRATANSLYTFQASFELSGYDLATTRVFGRFLADNGISEVRINGVPVEVESWEDNEFGQIFHQQQFRFINVGEGLVAGTNVVEVDVWNGVFQNSDGSPPRPRPNPMALRVEWYAFGRQMHESI